MDRVACLAIATLASNAIAILSFAVAFKARKTQRLLDRKRARADRVRQSRLNEMDLRVTLLEGFERQRYAKSNVDGVA